MKWLIRCEEHLHGCAEHWREDSITDSAICIFEGSAADVCRVIRCRVEAYSGISFDAPDGVNVEGNRYVKFSKAQTEYTWAEVCFPDRIKCATYHREGIMSGNARDAYNKPTGGSSDLSITAIPLDLTRDAVEIKDAQGFDVWASGLGKFGVDKRGGAA